MFHEFLHSNHPHFVQTERYPACRPDDRRPGNRHITTVMLTETIQESSRESVRLTPRTRMQPPIERLCAAGSFRDQCPSRARLVSISWTMACPVNPRTACFFGPTPARPEGMIRGPSGIVRPQSKRAGNAPAPCHSDAKRIRPSCDDAAGPDRRARRTATGHRPAGGLRQ